MTVTRSILGLAARGLVTKDALDADRLRENAERRTGLSQWGDSDVHKHLETTLSALKEEGNLSPLGTFSFARTYEQHLRNRLLFVAEQDRNSAPKGSDPFTDPATDPIFITGLYRSGTTFLHNLLADTPQLRALPYYQLRRPFHRGDQNALIRAARLERAIHRRIAPDFETAHQITATGPEECNFLFDNTISGTTSFFLSEAHDIADWLLEQDPLPAYRFFREQLQWIERKGRGRLILKWPFHLWRLGTLFEVFPGAEVIVIKRDPAQATASTCSLAFLAKEPMCRSVDLHRIGNFWLHMNGLALERYSSIRAKLPAQQLIEVEYQQLCEDPTSTVRDILGKLQPSEPAVPTGSATQRLSRRPHRYHPADYGLNRANTENLPSWSRS